MEIATAVFDSDLKATELRLGLPGTDRESDEEQSKSNKRSCSEMEEGSSSSSFPQQKGGINRESGSPPAKAQIVGWPPVRPSRKTILQKQESDGSGMFVKVSMDGAPYLRKIDLKFYSNYFDLMKALENMFKCTIGMNNGSEFAPTYEDKDGDWMLVGDVPWEMFITSCKRLRVMKGSEIKGLGCF